jgi:hypothetical protein
MKMSRKCVNLATIFVLASLLSACATDDQARKPDAQAANPVAAKPATPAPPPPESPEKIAEKAARAAAQADLDGIIALYNNGDYNGEIKRFASINDALKPYKDLELLGIKYTAFSYCLTRRITACRQQFENAFKLDPSFDLLPGEKGHPLWGPVFARVKKKEGS